MKKIRKNLLLTAMLGVTLFSAGLFSACKDEVVVHTFETNGGVSIAAKEVEIGSKYVLPEPTREGYYFEGWFLNPEFSGEAVTEVTADVAQTYYAKWTQLFTVTLNLDGGSYSGETAITLKKGANVYDAVKNIVPTKTGHQFGVWYNGNGELEQNTAITENLTLTAKYKVQYVVEIWKQDFDGTFVKETTDTVAYDYAGETPESPQEPQGFKEVRHDDMVQEKELSSTVSENVFKHFYERREYTVAFNPSYPDGSNGTRWTAEGKYETEYEIPSNYEYSGYCLMGWSLVPGGEIELKANYIENSLFNKGNASVVTKAKIEKDATYYGVWEKGRTDMFGSNDTLYIEDGEGTSQVAYLSRGGYFFKGTYTASTNVLRFTELNEPILGRLYGNDQFILYSAARATYHTLYVAGAEEPLVGTTTVMFDEYNGITYREEGQDASKGEYELDGAYYAVTFTSGPRAGEKMHIFIATTEIDGTATDIFQKRNETEFAMGAIPAANVNGGAFAIDSTDTISLNGYNMATRKQESKESTYGYSYDAAKQTLTCTSTANGQTTVYKLIDVKGTLAFVAYDETMNKEFTVAGTNEKLILNGAFGATYSTDTNTAEGLYTLEKSVFGGTVVSMETANGKKYAFRLYEETEGNTVAEKKAGGYAEFYYCQTSTGYFYAPLIVLNENEEDTATLYGYNYSNDKFVKVSQGVYDKNNKGIYTYTATEWFAKDVNVSLQFFDLYELKSCEFGVNKDALGVPVGYWYSWTAKNDDKTELAKTYTSSIEGTLVLVNGFAFYDDVIGYFEGTYTEEDGLIKMTTFSGALAYFELNENNFYRLESLPYTMTMVRADGRILATETIAVDGRGTATYTVYTFDDAGNQTSETPTKGVIQTLNDQTENGMPIYRFVANNNSVSFRFIMLYSSSGQHFSRFNEEVNGTYSTSNERLELDGYSYMGYYTDTDGVRKEGRYSVIEENVVTMVIDGVQLYFDIKTGKTFTKRGVEYGEYAVVKNQQDQGYYVELNGYNKAIVYKLVDDERDVIDGNAIYEKTEDGFMVTYTNGAETVELIGAIVGETFFIKNVNAAQTYIDQNTWTVLQLDNFGGAVRYTADGIKETGVYVLITDTFMYFESENGNGSVYDYDKATGIMTVCVLSEVSYYTKDFEALYFSDGGFAIFNGATRYYYKDNGLGGAVLYREATATDEASAINAYGFVEETFASFDEELNYNGKDYLKCDGSQLNFFRKEETKAYYPVPIADNKKVPFEKLSFQPTGEAEFAVTGTVVLDGITTFCEVVREKVGDNFEMFVLMQAGVGYYRFDIEAAYNSNEYNSKDNVYEVTGMKWVITSYAYAYLDTYYKHFLSDYQYGTDLLSGYKNNVGEFQLNQLYDTDGEKLTEGHYLTGKFFEGTKMYDVNGDLISFESATLTSSEDMKEHEAVFVGADYYTYHVYFTLKYHSAFGLWGYSIDAFTREETLETADGYKIIVERRMYSDTSTFIVGTQYKVTVEKDGESKVISDLTERLAVGDFNNLQYYYVERTPNGDGTEKVMFYSAKFVKEEVIDPNEKLPAPYKSAEYFEQEATIYTSEDGVWKVTYVEGLGIPFVEGERFDFVPDPGQYDEEKQAFVCKGSFNTYYVKIVGEYVTVEVENQTK